ncbi:MAG TPA: RodZ domain-containing protein [Stellaceae bacterium]|nr:RodZ domain-containing protein [Stellaceae bacterium]
MTFFQRIKTPFTESSADEQARAQPRVRLAGEYLQERREDLGLDLEEIGAMLRIKPSYLAALEQGRTHDLPGPTYAIGFVRAYAEFLGLDAEPILARFKAEASGVTARPDLALPVPLGERSLPGGAMVLVALILALCGYGIWYYLSTEERNRPERVAAVPAALQTPQPAPTLVPPPPAQPAADTDQAALPPSLSGANEAASLPKPADNAPLPPPNLFGAASPPPVTVPSGTAPTPSPPAASSAPTLALGKLITTMPRSTMSGPQPAPSVTAPATAIQATPVPPPATAPQPPSQAAQTAAAAAGSNPPAASGAPAAPAGRVAIRALADCWIQVRASDQSIVFSRVLKSGEVYNVPSRPGLSLRTGNAGALQIDVDGKTAPSIGGIGALRRDVSLDPAELTAGTAVHG